MATKNLSATITIGGTVTAGLKGALGSVKTQLQGIGSAVSALTKENKALSREIGGLSRAGKNVDELKAKYAATTRAVEQLRSAQKKLGDAQATRDRLTVRAGTTARVGAGATATGGLLIHSMVPGIQEAKLMQSQLARIDGLGFSAGDTKSLVSSAAAQKAFGVSTEKATETARDLASAFGDIHHAIEALPLALKQRAALKLYDSQHGTSLADGAAYSMGKVIEMRNGTKSPEEYAKQANMAHQVLVATGGRVTGDELQHSIRTGGIAAKSMSDEEFYYGGTHLMQEMGGDVYGTATMSLYQNLAQGKISKRAANNMEKFGLIGDHSKVKEDKAGQLKYLNPGALIGYDTFVKAPQKWVEQYLLPILKKNNIDPDDMTKVSEFVGQFVGMRTAANLLVTRIAQRGVIAKEYANSERADTIGKGFDRSKTTAAGLEGDAEAKFADAKLNLGNNILPLYTRALVAASEALVTFNKFTAENPALSNALVVGVTAVGVGLVILGPLLIAGSAVVGAYAAAQLAMAARTAAATAALATQGATAVATSSKLGAMAKTLGTVMLAANAGDYVAGKFGIGGKVIDKEQDEKNWKKATTWEKTTSGLARTIETVGTVIGLGNIANEAAAGRIKEETEYLKNRPDVPPAKAEAPKLPEIPTMRGATAAAMVAPVAQTNNFNITQQPGEDAEALAKRIAAQMTRQNAVRDRGALTDGASAQ